MIDWKPGKYTDWEYSFARDGKEFLACKEPANGRETLYLDTLLICDAKGVVLLTCLADERDIDKIVNLAQGVCELKPSMLA